MKGTVLKLSKPKLDVKKNLAYLESHTIYHLYFSELDVGECSFEVSFNRKKLLIRCMCLLCVSFRFDFSLSGSNGSKALIL